MKIRLLSLALLGAALLLILGQSGFFRQRALIGHDTQTYVDLSGLASGIGLSNFSSRLRPPGFSLFLALVTLGKIPNPNVVTYKFCGNSVYGDHESCETASSDQANTVKLDPLVYGYSNETAALFQRVVLAAKIIFILAVLFLFWTLSLQIPPLLAAASVAFVCWKTPMILLSAGMIYSEVLFPALMFIYISCIIVYLTKWRRVGSFILLLRVWLFQELQSSGSLASRQ